jgi:hypothetical protein
MLTGPKTSFGYFWDWANVDLRDDAYACLCALFSEFLAETFPYGPGDQLFGRPVRRRALHSITTAAKESGMHPKTLRKMLREVGLLTDEQARLPDSRVLFSAKKAEAILRDGPTAMSLKDIAREFNVPHPQTYILYRKGYLRPLFERRGHRDGLGLHFSRSHLEQFMAALLKDATPVVSPSAGQFPVLQAAHKANRSVWEIVDLILARRLTWVGKDVRHFGFKSILVKLSEVRDLTRGPDLPGVTKLEAAKALHVTERALNVLIARGFLTTQTARNPLNRCPQEVIAQKVMDAFNRDYATLGKLVSERNMHFQKIRRELKKADVHPRAVPTG